MWGNTTVQVSWVQTSSGKLRCSSGRHEELNSLILHIFPRHRYWAGSYQKAFISVTVVCIQPSLMQRTSDGTLSTLHSSTAMVITTAMSVTTSEDYGASLSHFLQITGQTGAPHWAWFSRRVLTFKRCFSFSSSPRACSQRVFWLLPFSLYYHKVFILQYKYTNVWFGTVGKSPASHNITNLSTVYQLCN